MTIKLSAEAEEFLKAQLAGGMYLDEAAVIEAALRHMKKEQEWKEFAEVAIEDGLAQSERGTFVSAEEIEALLAKFVRRGGKLEA